LHWAQQNKELHMPAQAVQTCRWAMPTLFLPWPLWYDASAHEWSCTRGAKPRGLMDPVSCTTCRQWAPAERRTDCGCHQDDHLGSIAP
jgi:hypothetical protein